MTKILDCLPPFPASKSVAFGERHVRIHRDERLVWVGIGLRAEDKPERVCPPFPALLDTANNCEFYLHEHHLLHGAGFRPALLDVLGTKYINQAATPCHEADVWIYPNQPGTTEVWKGKAPFRLNIPNGLAVAARQPGKPIGALNLDLRFCSTVPGALDRILRPPAERLMGLYDLWRFSPVHVLVVLLSRPERVLPRGGHATPGCPREAKGDNRELLTPPLWFDASSPS